MHQKPGENVSELIAQIRGEVGSATLTVLADPDDERRPLLSELVFSAIALFVMKQYASAFLRGLGLDELARRHGEAAKALLFRVRSGTVNAEDTRVDADAWRQAMAALSEGRGNARARSAAEDAIRGLLRDAGAPESQAADAARAVAAVMLREA